MPKKYGGGMRCVCGGGGGRIPESTEIPKNLELPAERHQYIIFYCKCKEVNTDLDV